MEVSFFGGAGEVGRSCIVVRSGDTRIMLDAGIKLGKETTFPEIKDSELRGLDAVFITHAHLDHCGYLPHIYSRGYTGNVYGTKPTLELVNVLISDYMHISEHKDITKEGLADFDRKQKVLNYGEELRVRNLRIRFQSAGHILGSSIIIVDDGEHRLIYTGDINLIKTKLLDGADLNNLHGDVLITESTYGGKHDLFNHQETSKQMVASIKTTLLAGGKIIVPSFAIGRSQEILLLLGDNMKSGAIPNTPVYIDGMINKAMRIHRHNVIYCRKELQTSILMSDYDPFKNDNFFPVEKPGARGKIMRTDDSSIIVTTSGMLTGGPILFYLPRMSSNSINKMILVGYQAEDTLGREIQEGAKEVKIDKRKVRLELAIESHHLSAHADRRQLEHLATKINGLKTIFIVHGEKSKSDELQEHFSKEYKAIVPKIGESFTV